MEGGVESGFSEKLARCPILDQRIHRIAGRLCTRKRATRNEGQGMVKHKIFPLQIGVWIILVSSLNRLREKCHPDVKMPQGRKLTFESC
jgi:hypothetical protein